jgi:antimicrobial peptide system SdpA family protein
MTPPSPAPTDGAPANDAALGGVALAVGALWIAAVAYAIYPALPYSPVRLPFAEQALTFLWAPQGWAFFTRDPREEKQTVYAKATAGWESVLLAPHGRLTNVFGLRRTSRAQGVEMALLIDGIPAEAWQPCTLPVGECLAQLPTGRPVVNRSPDPTMCGSVAVVLQKPLPWAWARSPRPTTMPARILALEVVCSRG